METLYTYMVKEKDGIYRIPCNLVGIPVFDSVDNIELDFISQINFRGLEKVIVDIKPLVDEGIILKSKLFNKFLKK